MMVYPYSEMLPVHSVLDMPESYSSNSSAGLWGVRLSMALCAGAVGFMATYAPTARTTALPIAPAAGVQPTVASAATSARIQPGAHAPHRAPTAVRRPGATADASGLAPSLPSAQAMSASLQSLRASWSPDRVLAAGAALAALAALLLYRGRPQTIAMAAMSGDDDDSGFPFTRPTAAPSRPPLGAPPIADRGSTGGPSFGKGSFGTKGGKGGGSFGTKGSFGNKGGGKGKGSFEGKGSFGGKGKGKGGKGSYEGGSTFGTKGGGKGQEQSASPMATGTRRGNTTLPDRPDKNAPPMNEGITQKEVRLVRSQAGGKDDMLGILPTSEALAIAQEEGVDLVLINATSEPPVAKLVDYGKLRYQAEKKKKENLKKGKTKEMKEVKVTHRMGSHDYQVRLKATRKFLMAGHRVQVTMQFKGRENQFVDLGREVLDKLTEDLEDVARAEAMPKKVGTRLNLFLNPAGDALKAIEEAARQSEQNRNKKKKFADQDNDESGVEEDAYELVLED